MRFDSVILLLGAATAAAGQDHGQDHHHPALDRGAAGGVGVEAKIPDMSAMEGPPSVLPRDDEDRVCGSFEFKTAKDIRKVITDTGALDALEEWIKKENDGKSDNWLERYERHVFEQEGRPSSDGCGLPGGKCEPGPESWECGDYWDEVESTDPYWIFESVKGMHSKLSQLRDRFQEESIDTLFNVSTMISELSGEDKMNKDSANDFLNFMGAAVGLAAGISGSIPHVAGPLAIVQNVLGAVAAESGSDDIDTASLTAALGDVYRKARKGIDDVLKLAVGDNDQVDNDDMKIPGLSPGFLSDKDAEDFHRRTKDMSDIGKFFHSEWWLLQQNSPDARDAVQLAIDGIRMKVADIILQTAGWILVGNTSIENEGDCSKTDGAHWMKVDGGVYCFELWMETGPTELGIFARDEDIYKTLKKYGFTDTRAYYREILECAWNGRDGVDMGDVGSKAVPMCTFDMEVKEYLIMPFNEKRAGTRPLSAWAKE